MMTAAQYTQMFGEEENPMNRQARLDPADPKHVDSSRWIDFGNVNHQEAACQLAASMSGIESVRVQTRDEDHPNTLFDFVVNRRVVHEAIALRKD